MSLSVALEDKHSTLKVKVIKKFRMGKATQIAKNENQNHLYWQLHIRIQIFDPF